ncbi:MAG: hypothetical protein V2G33_07605 [bacterium JZ-2024 1]
MKWVWIIGGAVICYVYIRLREYFQIKQWKKFQEKLFQREVPISPTFLGREIHYSPDSVHYGTYFVFGPPQRYCVNGMETRGRGGLYLYSDYIAFKPLLAPYPFYIPLERVYQVEKGKYLWTPTITIYWTRGQYRLKTVFGTRPKTVNEFQNFLHKHLSARKQRKEKLSL